MDIFFSLCQIFNKHVDSYLFLNNMPAGSRACSFNLHQSVLEPGLHLNVSAVTSGFDVPHRSSLASSLICRKMRLHFTEKPALCQTNKIHFHPTGHEMTAN